ncbi:hypothetical protein GBK02_15850 [Dechloromonas sp. TW-R-39-2]|uniref:hypothetical protein n=1 Tax=Dechloromonas sp. TW-R-39-2 TaxID=2654218 RepID=UPI00193CB27B|nr:hypothetical protein [Dechloromonas sp. TW-R-39-2]QRM20743.1 hypothetical protein GBK02_15850 [Dechloromonas sp. TW-R-39-2]
MLIISLTNPEMNIVAISTSTTEGCVLVLLAIQQIAKKYSIPEAEVKYEIAGALLSGDIFVRNTAGFPYQPDACVLSVEKIRLEDLNGYFASRGHAYRLLPEDIVPQCKPSSAGLPPLNKPRISVIEIRIQAILSHLEEMRVDHMNIPKGWYKVLEKHLTEELKLCTKSGFYDAWRAGRGKRFKTANHHINGRRHH